MLELDRITVQPDICMGQPCIRGMRIMVSVILKMLAAGKTTAEVIDAYPEIESDDIKQAMQYAAWIVSDQIQYRILIFLLLSLLVGILSQALSQSV